MFKKVTTLLCFCALLAGFCLNAAPVQADPAYAATYQKILDQIESGAFEQARALALDMIQNARPDDVEQAGAIRGVIDAFRAHNKPAIADELYNRANQAFKPSGQVAVVLNGRQADEGTVRHLRFVAPARRSRDAFNPATDLKRIRVGHQASILKIMNAANTDEVFNKGLDGVLWAPITDDHRKGIYNALGINPVGLDGVAGSLMDQYPTLKEKEQAIALLGAIGSDPGPSLSDATRRRLLGFLVARMDQEKTPQLRRQSVLALALLAAIDVQTINAVIAFYEHCDNLWITFPVQQFFEYQSSRLHKLANLEEIKTRVSAVNSMYKDNIMKFL